MKHQKGFTMVELLATIVILGLLTTVVVVGVAKTIQSSHQEYYENQENMLRLAGMEYFSDHRSELPKEVGEENYVLLSTLVDQKYIDEIVDINEDSCVDYEGNISFLGQVYTHSAVVVVKIDSENYSYFPLLMCPAYSSDPNNSSSGSGDGSSDNPGGGSGDSSLDCGSVSFSYEESDNSIWYNHDIIIGVSNVPTSVTSYRAYDCSSNTDCVSSSRDGIPRQIALSEEGSRYGRLTLFDRRGNTCTTANTKTYKIDKTAPTQPTVTREEGDDSLTLVVSSSDALSGIAKWDYSYDNSSWQTYSTANSETAELTFDEEMNETIYLRTCDKAGNCSATSSLVVDVEFSLPAPSIVNPTNGNWTNTSFSLDVSTTYRGSIAYWQYSYNNSSFTTYANSASSTFTTTPYSAERNQLTYIRYCNTAGECSPSSSTMIRIDKTRPTIAFTYPGGTYVANPMYNRITATDSNGISRILIHIYKNGSFFRQLETTDSTIVYTLDPTANYTVYVKAWDLAGNQQSQSPDNGAGWYYAGFNVTKKTATVLNNNYMVCPNDQLVPSRETCTTYPQYNTMYVSNVRVSGTTVTVNVRLHMNHTTVTWQRGQTRTLCVANSSNQCVINLKSFSIGSSGWTCTGCDPVNQDFSFDISSLSAGDYRIIVDGGTTKFRFRDSPYVLNTFRVTG